MQHDFPATLRRLRERRGISRRTLSELCGLHTDAIRRYERGEAEPSISALVAISDFFGVTVDELIKRACK